MVQAVNDWIAIRLEMIGIDAGAVSVLRDQGRFVSGQLPAILEEFYASVARHEADMSCLRDRKFIQGSVNLHVAHWGLITSGNFNSDLMASAGEICRYHSEAGITPPWYIGARLLFIMNQLTKRAAASATLPRYGRTALTARDDLAAAIAALGRAAAADTEITVFTYFGSTRQKRKDAIADARERFRTMITQLLTASQNLTTTSEQLQGNAGNAQELAGVVARASSDASANVQTVAVATEELAASVREIARQVGEANAIATSAVEQADQTDGRILALSQAAGHIGDVVKLITSVAEQTNLLALNATIEAARAGEAGRGFAVVAQEVKALAAQTAKATDEISTQITNMQAATQEAVASIKRIGATIGQISTISAAITTAIEEQGSATQDIARNVQSAASGATEVASNIAKVNERAGETGATSGRMHQSAMRMANDTGTLRNEIDGFLASIAATA
jgi:methyl-accepting chemotaxis protein